MYWTTLGFKETDLKPRFDQTEVSHSRPDSSTGHVSPWVCQSYTVLTFRSSVDRLISCRLEPWVCLIRDRSKIYPFSSETLQNGPERTPSPVPDPGRSRPTPGVEPNVSWYSPSVYLNTHLIRSCPTVLPTTKSDVNVK